MILFVDLLFFYFSFLTFGQPKNIIIMCNNLMIKANLLSVLVRYLKTNCHKKCCHFIPIFCYCYFSFNKFYSLGAVILLNCSVSVIRKDVRKNVRNNDRKFKKLVRQEI